MGLLICDLLRRSAGGKTRAVRDGTTWATLAAYSDGVAAVTCGWHPDASADFGAAQAAWSALGTGLRVDGKDFDTVTSSRAGRAARTCVCLGSSNERSTGCLNAHMIEGAYLNTINVLSRFLNRRRFGTLLGAPHFADVEM